MSAFNVGQRVRYSEQGLRYARVGLDRVGHLSSDRGAQARNAWAQARAERGTVTEVRDGSAWVQWDSGKRSHSLDYLLVEAERGE